MRRIRRAYYDWFSTFYDRFVSLHSRDKKGTARIFLVEQPAIRNGGSVLDLCTGTATVLPLLAEKVGRKGKVVGVDFSHGMLTVAQGKTRSLYNVFLVEADAGCLPFVHGSFDAVTCSHAFYELKGDTQNRALQEIVRVLKPGGTFLMMEHDVPKSLLVRGLFYTRLAVIGAGKAMTFLRHERELLETHFATVEKILAPAGRSKIMVCRKKACVQLAVDPHSDSMVSLPVS